jgi:hypothetical protein
MSENNRNYKKAADLVRAIAQAVVQILRELARLGWSPPPVSI